MSAEWRPVLGHPGYEVSSDGQVRSLIRAAGRYIEARAVPLVRKQVIQQGRAGITLRRRRHNVHVLVLEAFVGPRPPGMVGCHNNGNALDNRAENLRWATPAENVADAMQHGSYPTGERHKSSKLTTAAALEIKRGLLAGEHLADLARAHGVSIGTVSDIKAGRTWRHALLAAAEEDAVEAARFAEHARSCVPATV